MVHRYETTFYDMTTRVNVRSARIITRLMQQQLPVQSVVDFGCAQGGWLTAWQELGIVDLMGVDGHDVAQGRMLIDKRLFFQADLRHPVRLGRRFDLVESVEVAEHLPVEHAADFVATLVRHGDLVLFSAAPPGQGGEYHVNEQPYEYWRDLFLAQGYHLFDFPRWAVRNHPQVQSWYRYNLFLYVHEGAVERLPEAVRRHGLPPGARIPDLAPLFIRLTRQVVRLFSVKTQTAISQWLARWR
ncbi:MAG: methyltransferase domain-containing protein [Magnetococcales bacterium]|nr:methyltransferase domain-containing protein [Magnetococcales bacterium]